MSIDPTQFPNPTVPDPRTLYEKNQRVRALSAILSIVLLASVALGLLNIPFRTWDSVIALFGLAFIFLLELIYTFHAQIISIFPE